MKKQFLFLLLVPYLMMAQSVFDSFDGQDDVKSVIVNKKMFQMMGNVKNKESQQYLNLISKLDNLKVFTTSSTRVTAEMRAAADKHIKTAGLEELMRITEKGQNIRIMVKSGSSETTVKELLMYIEGSGKESETVLMSLTGDFDLNEISLLTERMNLPGGDQLNKAKGKRSK